MKRLIILGLVVVLVAVMSAPAALFATGGGNGDNGDNGDNGGCDKNKSSSKCEYPKKVTICHIPPGNPGNAHTIRVSQNAVNAHLAHGDHLGKCANGNHHGKKHKCKKDNGNHHHRGDDD